MSTKELIDSAIEHLRGSASVKTVYGDPVVVDGKTVIPVAKVAFGFGGGTGKKEPGEGKTPSEGEGAGGGVMTKPVGVVEISGQETKFVPFGQTKKLAIVALVGSGLGLGLGLLLGRKASKH
jgi:uncharacterized spore protein YtfJ